MNKRESILRLSSAVKFPIDEKLLQRQQAERERLGPVKPKADRRPQIGEKERT